jgi:hypothetical protein
MIYNFCTLFDRNYAYQGIALYNSLLENYSDWQIFILCLDEETYSLLTKLKLEKARLIKLSDIEDEKLLKAKSNRSKGEYCWTLASVFTYYLLKKHPELENIAYLDSDIYFYSSPAPIYEELANDSVLIIKHNYPKQLQYLEKNGIYNVAMVIFKNNPEGLSCLKWWQDEVLKWCYNKCEDGKFGDQAYLDDWTTRFKGVHVLNHVGGDVAPWNLGKYEISVENEKIKINNQDLIFFHFHTFKIISENKFQLHSSFYSFNKKIEGWIYSPYIKEIKDIIKKTKEVDAAFNYGYRTGESILDMLKQKAKKLLVIIYFSHKKYGSSEKNKE